MSDASAFDNLHPGHHSIRLKGVDYSGPGFYLVTICSLRRRCIFGEVRRAQVSLNILGKLAHECWVQIPTHFRWVTLLDFVVMPNHVHGIIEIARQQGRDGAGPLRRMNTNPYTSAGSLGVIVRSFKAIVTKRAHLELKQHGQIWQTNYYETIIRPGRELTNARAYIGENPQKWQWDQENPGRHTR